MTYDLKFDDVRAVLQVLWGHVRRFKYGFIFVLLTITVAEGTNVFVPIFYKRFFDALSIGQEDRLVAFLLVILALHALGWLLWRSMALVHNWLQPTIMVEVTKDAHEALHRQSYRFFLDAFAGTLVRRVGRLERAYEVLTDQLQFRYIPLTVMLIGNLFVLYTRHYMLAVILAAWTILFIVFNTVFSLWKWKYDLQRVELDSEATGVLADSITNGISVKLFTGQTFERELYRSVMQRLRRMMTFTWNLGEIADAVQASFMVVIEFLLMYYAVRFWRMGILTIGDFALIQGYLLGMFGKLWDFGREIRRSYEAIADASEMVTIIRQRPDVTDARSAKELDVQTGRITFDNVFFSFRKTRRILNGLSLTIEPGEKVALVGPSGAGKSTLTKLLLRFYDIERGKILIGNQNIAKVTQESLRANIALVPQEPILFHRTIMDNIRYGRRDATDEEVMEAAKQARCHEFIVELQDGYNTYVGERGVKLSGGERQRVAIARAILKNAPILILDEATSSLDSESEALIQEAMDTLMRGKTTIVIAHRLSTIMRMDRILVIENGRLADQGTHKQLVRKHGTYRNLWDIQAGGFLN